MLSYATTKEIVIRSWKLRLLKLTIQLGVAAYLGWVIFVEKGYQKQTNGFGFTQVSVQGNAYSIYDGEVVIWDSTNIVVPSKERCALFLTTNYLFTRNQTRGVCEGSAITKDKPCNCTYLEQSTNGLATGTCGEHGYCNLYAWCPIEQDLTPTSDTVLEYVRKFNVTVKNYARFPDWGFARDNDANGPQIPHYNFFTVQEMIEKSGYTFDNVSVHGTAIGAIANWDCDFDKNPNECKAKWSFLRLDPVGNSSADSVVSTGFNFRYTQEYRTEEYSLSRDLYKVYGIRLLFLTAAVGRKFDIVVLVIKMGSAIGMMALANYASDLLCMWLLPFGHYYRNRKFMNVDEQTKETKRMEWKGILSQEDLNKAYF